MSWKIWQHSTYGMQNGSKGLLPAFPVLHMIAQQMYSSLYESNLAYLLRLDDERRTSLHHAEAQAVYRVH